MTVQDGDILRISARQTYLGGEDDMVGVYHYAASNLAETDAQSLLNIAVVIENLYLQVNARVDVSVAYEEITVKNVTQNLILGDTPWPTLTNGLLADALLPSPVCALIVASVVSPSRQARKYLGGFTEADNIEGGIGATLLTSLANFATQYVLNKTQGGVLYRPLIVLDPLAIPPTFELLQVGKVITNFRTQRRRTRGRGS